MDVIPKVRAALDTADIDAWLAYDFRGTNRVAHGLIAPLLRGGMASRRMFLLLPRRRAAGEPAPSARQAAPGGQAETEPVLLVHKIEQGSIPPLPFEVRSYSSRDSLVTELGKLLAGVRTVAMEFSPEAENPYVGIVDAGTVQLVRSFGVEVVSSGDVAQVLTRWTPDQVRAHLDAAEVVLGAKDAAFAFIAERLDAGGEVREAEVQHRITRYFVERGFDEGHPSDVSFGAHAGDPHYVVREGADAALRAGDVVLIDLWAKRAGEEAAPFADVTWMGVCGEPSGELVQAFEDRKSVV